MDRRKFLLNSLALGVGSALSKIAFAEPLKFRNSISSPFFLKDPPMQMTPVLMRSYNNARTCTNTRETVLNVNNVTTKGIKKLFSLSIPGDKRGCEAQTLIVPNVIVNGVRHNLAILATMANTVLAYDADTGNLLWTLKIATPVNGGPAIDAHTINDHWGILSTPVIDAATNVLYCVAWSSATGDYKNAVHSFYAINILTGKVIKGPLSLEGVAYDPGNNLPIQKYASIERKQRCGLLLTN
jgi:hypothetical protein